MPYSIDALTDDCYPGTTVLINRFDIRDAVQLAEVESRIVPAKSALWQQHPLATGFDFAHYKAIHAFLFGDLYSWAGQVRTINLSKKGTVFCPADQIEQKAAAIFDRLRRRKFFCGLPLDAFACELTDFYQRTNELHPFREGNGRAQRLFLSELCRYAGYDLDFSRIDTDLLMIATIQAANGVEDLLRQLLTQALERQI